MPGPSRGDSDHEGGRVDDDVGGGRAPGDAVVDGELAVGGIEGHHHRGVEVLGVSGPIEDARTETFDAAPTSGGIRTRGEAALVQRYASWMAEHGKEVERQQYAVSG